MRLETRAKCITILKIDRVFGIWGEASKLAYLPSKGQFRRIILCECQAFWLSNRLLSLVKDYTLVELFLFFLY